MKRNFFKTAVLASMIAVSSVALNGCTYNYDEQNRRIMEEGSTYDIVYARIVSVTPVKIKENKYDGDAATAAGVVGGAVVGSAIGYNSHHHHYSGYDYYGRHYHGRTGSSGGAIVGGLVGAGVGLLIGEAIKSANNVEGLRLNLITSTNDNFAVDVPRSSEFRSGGYVQVNISRSGHTQVVPISREAYDLALRNGGRSSRDYVIDDDPYLNSKDKTGHTASSSSVIEYEDY